MEFNYPIDINGAVARLQLSIHPALDNAGWEFDAPFTRLEYVAGDCFHLSYLATPASGIASTVKFRFPRP
jgi:hypothetical protein